MIQRIKVPVSVVLDYDHRFGRVMPKQVLFEGRLHQIIKLGFHHTYREGRTLYHVFSVASPTLFFRLVLDTDNLHWRLEEVADGETN